LQNPSLATVAREWARIGCVGFGGPPAHISLLRRLVVDDRGWLEPEEFEDAVAACNLLPGPASTQLAIFCARRVRGTVGALIGGVAFIVPGLALILALSALFLESSPPDWIRGAGAGMGAAVAAVAVRAACDLIQPSRRRAEGWGRLRWLLYVTAGGVVAATAGVWVVVVLLACGAFELTWRRALSGPASFVPLLLAAGTGGSLSLVWTAFKVGALSYGGGFVIVPLMQGDAVSRYHWLTKSQFLNAVALGQITPGPVVQTVAAVGYGAAGLGGGLLAALVAFSPSFAFVLVGGSHFERLRENVAARAFLAGAGPAAIGAILGAAVPLTRALSESWQYAVLGGAALLLLPGWHGVVRPSVVRPSVVLTLLIAGAVGVAVALGGGPLPA
jgi:chromate transporter